MTPATQTRQHVPQRQIAELANVLLARLGAMWISQFAKTYKLCTFSEPE